MKNFNLYLLTIILLIWFSDSSIGFAVVGPFTSSAFICLIRSVPGSEYYAITRIYQNSHSPAGIDPYGLQTVINAMRADMAPNAYVEICRGINATSQINLVKT